MADADAWATKLQDAALKLGPDLNAQVLAEEFPDVGDGLDDLCEQTAQAAIKQGDTVIRLDHFQAAAGGLVNGESESGTDSDESYPTPQTDGQRGVTETAVADMDREQLEERVTALETRVAELEADLQSMHSNVQKNLPLMRAAMNHLLAVEDAEEMPDAAHHLRQEITGGDS